MDSMSTKNEKLNQLGRIKFLDQKTNTFVKIYRSNILKDDFNQILKRVSIINSFVKYDLSIPLTRVVIDKDEIVVSQKYLKKSARLTDIPKHKRTKLIVDLELTIATLHSIGFVHGDINHKNIIYSENKLWLVDFEPSLIQMKKGKKKWMVSRPYAFPEDLKNKDVTTATDVYAFDCFKKWFIGV